MRKKRLVLRGISKGAKFIVVLIALVLIFKEQMTDIVNNIFKTITSQSGKILK